MKKLFTFIFAIVLLISFACSLPEPPPVPGMTNGSSSNTYSSESSGGSTAPVQSTSTYSSSSYSDKQGFFGGIGTLLLEDGSLSWSRFILFLIIFIAIIVAIVYLNMQRKKALVNNSSAIGNETSK